MKRIAAIALLLLAASVARADTIVSVSLNPFDFGHQISFTGQDLGDEILAATFTWDTTTGTLSHIVVAASGPFQPLPYSSTLSIGGPDIWFMSWQLTDNAIYSLNYGLHSLGGSPGLSSTPGVHYTNSNLNLWCACMSGDQDAFGDTATVTAISNKPGHGHGKGHKQGAVAEFAQDSDPVSTPEPSTLMLLGVTSLLGFLVKVIR